MLLILNDHTGGPKVIVTPPSQYVEVTHSVMLIATASGIGVENFSYQWQREGKIIKNETKSVLLINNVIKKSSKYHSYSCIVTNEYGNSSVSNTVKLLVRSKLSSYYTCVSIIYVYRCIAVLLCKLILMRE